MPGSPVQFIPSVVVFGDENTVINLPVEIEPETEEEIEETLPLDTNAEDVDSTEASDTEPVTEAKGGCGGAVSFVGITVIALLGTCAALGLKKKED